MDRNVLYDDNNNDDLYSGWAATGGPNDRFSTFLVSARDGLEHEHITSAHR